MRSLFIKRAHVVYYLLRRLVKIIPALDSKLRIASALGKYAWKNHVGIYVDKQLEEYLVDLVTKHLHLQTKNTAAGSKDVLHVLSGASHVGGHTRVVERFSSYRSLGNSEVLIVGSVTPEALRDFEDKQILVHQFSHLIGSSKDRIASIRDVLLRYKIVILHIHPDDIETTVAAGLAKKINRELQVAFYNHADHVFSYGYSVADRVLEITWLGWSKRASRNTERLSSFVGIPLDCGGNQKAARKNPSGDVINLISVGSSYKYIPDDSLSFFDFMDLLFEVPNVHLTIIGVSASDDRRWALYKNKYASRLQLLGLVSSSELERHLQSADIYVDSFPLSGGTAFPQGLIQCGVALAPRLPVAGFTPADLIRVESLSEMIKTLRRFSENPATIIAEYRPVKELTIAAHSDDCVEHRLRKAIMGLENISPPWPKPEYADYDYFETTFRRNGIFNNEYSWSLPQPFRFIFRLLSGNHFRAVQRLLRHIRVR